jgi:hypothetical protein
MGVIVIGDEAALKKLQSKQIYAKRPPEEVREILLARIYRWVYAEAQPRSRIVIMTESEARRWVARPFV